ncbi:MAG: hypothetical protein HY763_07585 [Planctomycetes bacterium]|nr:hypothetical protein [Planctomycetota bacterium]
MFTDARPFAAGWQFQVFIDADNNSGTGYAKGYDRLARGVETAAPQAIYVRDTTGGGGPGGWGPVRGTVSFTMTDDWHLEIEVPLAVAALNSGDVKFAFESYFQHRLVDSRAPQRTTFDGGSDCNGNGIRDDLDISSGFSEDCDDNRIPDECDIAAGRAEDCNENGTPDGCDIASGGSSDCMSDGVPDECEPDCNANGIGDSCDLAAGTSRDCDGDAVPDECQPFAAASGSRYLTIHPAPATQPMALRVTGSATDPQVRCVSGFVQADGSLGMFPVYQTSAQWCTVNVTGDEIIGGASYLIQPYTGSTWLPATRVTTPLWCDFDRNNVVNFTDLQIIVGVYVGSHAFPLPQVDAAPCVPDGVVNFTDIQVALQVFGSASTEMWNCVDVCP